MSINEIMIKEYNISQDDIAYHKNQFNVVGMCYILQHPYLKDTLEDADMYLMGDCYFCDSHNDKNFMCVFSRQGKDIYSVCENCFTKHTFINFNL